MCKDVMAVSAKKDEHASNMEELVPKPQKLLEEDEYNVGANIHKFTSIFKTIKKVIYFLYPFGGVKNNNCRHKVK